MWRLLSSLRGKAEALPYGNLALPHRICTGSFNSSNQAAFVELDGDLVDAEPIAWGEGMSVSESR